ncbi:MAG TPA: hypothetical protein VHW01_22290 [Polyangiaceae bacterium]|jgi:hypothetical protein|nr:hypothetical protein [Polyangiaceae bacterium]
MRLNALWVGCALCWPYRVALAQGAPSAAALGSAETAAQPSSVPVGPQREEAPPASSNMDDVFGGDSNGEQHWRAVHPVEWNLNAFHPKPFRAMGGVHD